MCVIDIPRNYLFEPSETVFDTQSLELFDDVGDPENFPKTGEIIKIQTKYGWRGFQQMASRRATWAHC